MFSERVICEKLARFTEKYGWTPVQHSIAEIEKATAYILSLCTVNAKGEMFFDDVNWTPRLVRFVQNERAMCAIDCAYFLTRYYMIAANNSIIHFTFRGGQKAFYKVCQDLEAAGKSIEIQCLKARQQGFTTLIEGIMTHRGLFVPGAKCSVASANDQKTYVMMGMMYTALEHLPFWLTPTQTKDKRSGAAILEFSHVGTAIVVQSGSMKGGIGQGTTPTAVHLSEVCDWTDPVMQIEEGLFRAVHASPEIFMVLESTGNGNTGWWADQWRSNKEYYHLGRSRLYPLFIPWYMTPELYPTQTWIKDHPVPVDFEANKASETHAMRIKCETYAHNTDIIRRVLGDDWKMPIEQQWFWEFNYQYGKRRRAEKSWLRQMPCDDFEALTGDKDSVFDQDSLNLIEQNRKREFDAYGILGEGVAEKHDPPTFDVDGGATRLYAEWTTPKEDRYEWTFMPMRYLDPEKPTFNPMKKLLIYEHPMKGCDYAIGVDTGTGVGGDRSIISVSRTQGDEKPDIQVAEFCSDDITNVEIYAYVMAISALYATYMEEGRHPKLIIEQKRKYGDTCQHQLLLHGMKRHHEFVAYDKKTFKAKVHAGGRLGWFTNEWSRPMLLGMFKYAVENGWYVVNSRWLLEEIEGFEQHLTTSGKTRMDHQTGKHDDRIFAGAMSYFTSHHLDLMMQRAKLKYNSPVEEGYTVDYGPYYPTIQGDDFLEQYGDQY